MSNIDKLETVVRTLRSPEGCPWDRVQTHDSLKATCIEEAAEVVCGINILEDTGKADNLKEELGDLLLQVVFHAQIAEDEGLFNLDDVIDTVSEKMIRRHPHVFGPKEDIPEDPEERKAWIHKAWDDAKAAEKNGREWEAAYLPDALDEADELIDRARVRKGLKQQ